MGLFNVKKNIQFLKRNELSPTLQLIFLKRLHRLLKRGYSLNNALDIIRWDEAMKDVVQIIQTTIYGGAPLDEALKKAKFHKLIVMYIYFVRINGDLLSNLNKSIHMFEQRLHSLEKFKRVSRYPIFLTIIFLILLFIIRQFILPSYVEMFQFHAHSAATVNALLFTLNIILTAILISALLLIIVFSVWKKINTKLSIEKQLQLYSYIPILRDYVRLQTSFYFATYTSLFLKTGLSMKQVIEHMKEQKEFPILQYYASIMLQHLSKGYYLDSLLQSLPFFDRQLATIFQKHNHVDSLQKDLATYADFVAENIKHKTIQTIMIIQPATFTILGIFIVFIYISLLWPMFQLLESI